MSNNAPFAVGQRVVCIDDSPGKVDGCKFCEKDRIYIVQDTFFDWNGVPNIKINGWHKFVWASRFAPYDPPAIEIPAELLKEPKHDQIDVEIKELV